MRFWVNLYIDQYATQYRLSEMIQQSFNGYLNNDLTCTEDKIYFPVFHEAEGFYLIPDRQEWNFWINGEEVASVWFRKPISHGDYLKATHKSTSYSALFLDESKITLSSVLYETDFSAPITIGRAADTDICIQTSGIVSTKHAAIRKTGKTVYVEDISQQGGVFVNGIMQNKKKLMNGDEISIGGITIIYLQQGLIVPCNVRVARIQSSSLRHLLTENQSSYYIRTPRIYKSLETGNLEIDPPNNLSKPKEVPFLLSVGPSLTMSMAMLVSLGVTISKVTAGGNMSSLFTSGAMTMSMLAGALLWPKLQRKHNENTQKEEQEFRFRRYSAYISETEQQIRKLYERNTRVWKESLFPAPQNLISMLAEQNRRIWERTPEDADFLEVRFGTGLRPFEVNINTRRKGFVLDTDMLADKAGQLAEKYRFLKDVPITVSLLEKKVVGILGQTYNVAKNIIFNLAFFHSSDEVKLILIYNAFQRARYAGLSLLPHTWSDDKSTHYVATNTTEANALFTLLDEEIRERDLHAGKNKKQLPHYLFLIMDHSLIEEAPFKKQLINNQNELGISAVFFAQQFNELPKECSAIVQKDKEYCGIYLKNENDNRFMVYTPDQISDDEYARFVSLFSKIRIKDTQRAAKLPDRISFLDVLQTSNIRALSIANRWNNNASHKSLAAVIGVRSGGETFSLDIHEKHHGCHGLVAGTTGSGKSEFLQAYILSMMINYSPNEVAFVLIDFKGGDMARPFLEEPHLAAVVDNLSENMLYRALVSLEAEVKSRQRLINAAAKELNIDKLDINSYHKYFKENRLSKPLPHLIIVIDEFAQLKTQHAEFMAKLIDVAQVGRSLGIHLILATQKPNGVVDPQIWSNSRFKVCLKVTDKQDSNDVIGHPDAAMLKLPGRAYVQIGYDEIYELIQAGYSGADYIPKDRFVEEESCVVSMISNTGEKLRSAKDVPYIDSGVKKTQLEEIAKELANVGRAQNLRTYPLWQEPLPGGLLYEACDNRYTEYNYDKWDSIAPGKALCGKIDLPTKQIQIPYEIDFIRDGHMAVYGIPGSGTSTFIQTIAYSMALRYSPEWFNLIVLDFDGGSLANLSNMPHCISYVSGDNESIVAQTLNQLQAIIEKRRAMFAEYNCTNYQSYISESTSPLPVILFVLENYSSFHANMYKQSEQLIRMLGAAKTCGIYAVITGSSKSAIHYKVIEQLSQKIVFGMNDHSAYNEILGVRTPIRPEKVKGRALLLYGEIVAEVQIAVPFNCENESARAKQFKQLCEQMKLQSRKPAVNFVFDETNNVENAIFESPYQPTVVPISPVIAPLPPVAAMERPLTIGNNTQTRMEASFETFGGKRIFIGNLTSENDLTALLNHAVKVSGKVYLFASRSQIKCEGVEVVQDIDLFISNCLCGAEVAPAICIIEDFCDFFDRISDDALAKLERFLKGDETWCFITIGCMEKLLDYCDAELYIHLVRAEDGLMLGGNVTNQTAFMLHNQVKDIPLPYRARELKPRQALMYHGACASYVDIFPQEGV